MKPGKMLKQVLESALKKPATKNYPREKMDMPEGFRGKLKFFPEKCIGCKMCVRDCPADAIEITKTQDTRFRAKINLARCVYCAQCVDSCPKKALASTSEYELAQLDKAKLTVVFPASESK